MDDEIVRDLERLFEVLCAPKFEYSKKLDSRDFAHLYDFQKYFLYKTMRTLMEMVKNISYLYWNQKKMIMTWKNLSKFFKYFTSYRIINTYSRSFRFKFRKIVIRSSQCDYELS